MSAIMNAMTNTSNEFSQAIANNKSDGDDLDKEAFMLLLVTQFQYQDPLNPMEDKEFIAQLSQFSSLEQLMNLNDSMNNLSAVTQGQEMINATSYIGKAVDVSGNVISKSTNTSTGDVTVTGMLYALGEPASSAYLNIINTSGDTIRTITLPPLAAGQQPEFVWDGLDYNGNPAPDGLYQVAPAFINEDGTPIIDYDMVVEGMVSGVTTNNGVTYLTLADGRNTLLSEVRRVSEPTVISNTDTDGDTTDPTNTSGTNTTNTTTTGTNTTNTTEPTNTSTTNTTTAEVTP